MDLGKKIFELRKKIGLSQEQLAEKLNVTRQTISKWELNETTPDIKQAKILSEIFQISLDELVDNNIEKILVGKVSNVEKLAGIIINILKFIGILFIIYCIFLIIAVVFFTTLKDSNNEQISNELALNCSLANKDYMISITSDGYFNCSNCEKQVQEEIKNLIDFSNLNLSVKKVENYFDSLDGYCE